mgnify:CR=1 FL=1
MTLDLHADTVEGALERVVHFLDRAVVSREYKVMIVHGHGTGKLKKAVREYVLNSPYVADSHPGEVWEGGDGVTVVTLAD